jgi:hypothetical protein
VPYERNPIDIVYDVIYVRCHRTERERGRVYATHTATALIAVDTEFAADGAHAAVIESDAAEHAEYQSDCSAGVSATIESRPG